MKNYEIFIEGKDGEVHSYGYDYGQLICDLRAAEMETNGNLDI